MNRKSLFRQFLVWRLRHVSNRQFMMILSILVGIGAGLAAVIIKNSVHFISELVHHYTQSSKGYLYLITPSIGIFLSVLFIKYVIKRPVRHGIPNVLYAISKNQGQMNRHNMFSSIITSALTVGFGGSVGLEGPTVSTGAAIGSNVGQLFRLNYRQIKLLLGCACAGAMAAIFKAPIAAIVFALEVIMLDLTLASLVPILMASISAVVTSYLFMGQEVVYPFDVTHTYELKDLIYYILLGIIAGFVATYFTRVYILIEQWFERFNKSRIRLLVGSLLLGTLLFFFPSLYGEGYEYINQALAGDFSHVFDGSVFAFMTDNFAAMASLLSIIILLKVVAASLTFGSGGVGGIFAPTLFMGANTGLLFASIVNKLGFHQLHTPNFALIGMAGLIAGVLQAPLTGIFLIADLSGGYEMFLPLMITATASFATTKTFVKHSVYTHQLAQRRELITHDKDHAVLTMMEVKNLIENDFAKIKPDANLGDLVQVISEAHRNLFPVVDDEGQLHGMIKMDDIRKIIFKPELYESTLVRDLMYMPEYYISPDDSMEDLVEMFRKSSRFNIAVIDKGKYLGFISRANAFTAYRNQLKQFT
ncbi:chloride channel protein [Carboxylicivirga mesophila]|uniref:Chloride channel protein n=1 Tax=Carboxylicivirga mesophila TaxID=1166478 RepID=A0ABS5K849_9BACT|nr:chloride channel protein [Carboxylicivirga mesophila]MBS2211160.1 chloride channel protein [Carboxylicivirga mesophila]